MTIDEKKGVLTRKWGLEQTDWYINSDTYNDRRTIVLKRTGIDKIASKINMVFNITGGTSCPVNGSYMVTIFGRGESNGKVAETSGEASPENTKNSYKSAMAEKRLRHRLILKLADLYDYGVHSEDESPDFKPLDKLGDVLKELDKKISAD